MFHLAAIGHVYEGPGLAGRSLAILKAPVSTLCGARVVSVGNSGGSQEHRLACKACLRLMLMRTSDVVPLLFGG